MPYGIREPVWADVVFDHHLADVAVVRLRAAAEAVTAAAVTRATLARTATAQWRGRYRREFDAGLASVQGEAGPLADELRAQARRIEQASEAAAAEQRARVADRERYRREVARARHEEAEARAEARAEALRTGQAR